MPPRMFSSLSAELTGSSIDDSLHDDARQDPASYRPTCTRKLHAMTANLESLVARRKWNCIRSLLSSADSDSDLLEVYAQNSAIICNWITGSDIRYPPIYIYNIYNTTETLNNRNASNVSS